MPPVVKLAEYLFTRLTQLGIGAIHGVPGDYNLELLDYVRPAGLHWVGNTNELNAGYAVDGYARIKGVGAIITTFGVGELSALNAIAGAYAERAAVVHIVGTPHRATQESRLLVHHTLNDGDYRRFSQMHAQITVAQADLKDPRTSPAQIDEVLRQCLFHCRPVYIEFPVDMVGVSVSADRLEEQISLPGPVPSDGVDNTIIEVLDKIKSARQPIILVDGETRALGIINEVQSLVRLTKWPTWTTAFGKGLMDEKLPNFHGIYRGSFAEPREQDFFAKSDLILCFGPHFSSTNSHGFSSIPSPDVTVSFSDTRITIGKGTFRDIPANFIVSQILERLELSNIHHYDPYPDLPHDTSLSFSDVPLTKQPVTHDKFWHIFASYLRVGDIVLGETGTAGHGIRQMRLPSHTRFFTPATWLSIGYMLPAAQGAALAQRELITSGRYHGIKDARTILFIGDGSFQMTVQELSTMFHNHLNVIVFVINNDGYTIERCIHGLHAGYNDVASWRYLKAPEFLGASEDTYTASVRTWEDLKNVLENERLSSGKGVKLVEVFTGREDVPVGPLLSLLKKERARNGSDE
ncbi:MAG: hypothetical protein M1822_003142 [Bathelium mastoideum]|nr:MAG: hypothetical protein M1822_003142 [Bathelium mastoideum]